MADAGGYDAIHQWVREIGFAKFTTWLAKLDSNVAYDSWLRGELGMESVAVQAGSRVVLTTAATSKIGTAIDEGLVGTVKEILSDGAVKMDFDHMEKLVVLEGNQSQSLRCLESCVDVVSLPQLRADPSRDSGHRCAYTGGILQKLRDLCTAKGLRAHDTARLCELSDQPRNAKPAYVKFHYRGCALHAMAGFHFERALPLPPWFHCFKAIPAVHAGTLTTTAMMAEGLAASASLEHGVVRISWIETVLAVQNRGDQFGVSLAERLHIIAPEYASKVGDWQHHKSLVNRVHPNCYKDIIDFQERFGMSVVPIPSSWLRVPWVLQCGERRAKDNISELEQQMTIKRWLGELARLAAENGFDYAQEKELFAAQRLFTETLRRRCRDVAVKFVAGVTCAAAATKRDYFSLVEFASGKNDGVIYNTVNPKESGRYWDFILAADAKADADLTALHMAANEREVEDLRRQAAHVDRDMMALVDGDLSEAASARESAKQSRARRQELADKLRDKLRALYLTKLREHSATTAVAYAETALHIGELIAAKSERCARESIAADDRRALVWATGLVTDEDQAGSVLRDVAADRQPDLLMILDAAIAPLTDGEIRRAIRNVGTGGVVAILDYTNAEGEHPQNDALRVEIAHVQSVHAAGADCVRVFLYWDGPPRKKKGSCLLATCTSGEHKSELQDRVLSSDAVQTGIILSLASCPPGEEIRAGNGAKLLPDPLGVPFFEQLFERLDVFGMSALGDALGARVSILERDGGDGSVLMLLSRYVQADAGADSPPMPWLWLGSVHPQAPYPVARTALLQGRIQETADREAQCTLCV